MSGTNATLTGSLIPALTGRVSTGYGQMEGSHKQARFPGAGRRKGALQPNDLAGFVGRREPASAVRIHLSSPGRKAALREGKRPFWKVLPPSGRDARGQRDRTYPTPPHRAATPVPGAGLVPTGNRNLRQPRPAHCGGWRRFGGRRRHSRGREPREQARPALATAEPREGGGRVGLEDASTDTKS